jgi:hypothetical protein
LEQERKIKHRIGVGRRGVQRTAQAFDRGFRPALLVEQVERLYQASANGHGDGARAVILRMREGQHTSAPHRQPR